MDMVVTNNSKAFEEQANSQDNPLVWPLLTVLQASTESWKVHCLAAKLVEEKLLLTLDEDPNQDLFKRNFLLMNALYQLQTLLQPDQWLQVHAMDIRLSPRIPHNVSLLLAQEKILRDYYLDWNNYDVSGDYIQAMLEQFWHRFDQHIGANANDKSQPSMVVIEKIQALNIFELSANASDKEIRQQWRLLALRWHPDRCGGNAAKFRVVCEAWQILRTFRNS